LFLKIKNDCKLVPLSRSIGNVLLGFYPKEPIVVVDVPGTKELERRVRETLLKERNGIGTTEKCIQKVNEKNKQKKKM